MLKPAVHLLDHVLPVIDLKRGQVVHAVAGKREQYQALRSQLVDSFHPGQVAKAVREHLAINDLYVADLDAIAGEQPDWNSFAAMSHAGCELWIDAGFRDLASIRQMTNRVSGLQRVIVGLESLSKLRMLEDLCATVSPQQLVFSLDLRDGVPITEDESVKRMSAETIAAYAIDEGIRSLIILDLATVGSSNGGDTVIDICRNVRSRHIDVEILSGGGVRDLDDVNRFVEAGCNRVLVSTAIHNGML